jgi:hypothetical protein
LTGRAAPPSPARRPPPRPRAVKCPAPRLAPATTRALGAATWALGAVAAGCSTPSPGAAARPRTPAPSVAPTPAAQAPSPESVTRDEPGGDAPNPGAAALQRLLTEPLGARNDKPNTVAVALADAPLWKRVRFRLVPAYVGFRYGNAHHALAAFVVRDPPKGGPVTSDACLHDFEVWGRDFLRMIGGRTTDPTIARARWRDAFITVRTREGSAPWLFETKRYAGAYGAYVLEGPRCGIVAYAFSMAHDADLARRVRDRFAREAFERLDVRAPLVPPAPPLTRTPPGRRSAGSPPPGVGRTTPGRSPPARRSSPAKAPAPRASPHGAAKLARRNARRAAPSAPTGSAAGSFTPSSRSAPAYIVR